MRLIDADALIHDIEHYNLSDGKFQHWVEIQPTIEPFPHWIPCSERLPKQENEEQRRGFYLTTNAYGSVGVSKYEFCGDFGFVGWGDNRPPDIRIVAWMPLPEPYGGEQE